MPSASHGRRHARPNSPDGVSLSGAAEADCRASRILREDLRVNCGECCERIAIRSSPTPRSTGAYCERRANLQEVLDSEVDDVRAKRVRELVADGLQADDERRAEVCHHEPEELDPEVVVAELLEEPRAPGRGAERLALVLARVDLHVGFGCIFVSEIEAPNILANVV